MPCERSVRLLDRRLKGSYQGVKYRRRNFYIQKTICSMFRGAVVHVTLYACDETRFPTLLELGFKKKENVNPEKKKRIFKKGIS